MVIIEQQRSKRRYSTRYITTAEAAKRVGLHRNTVLWNIRKGYLRASFDGHRYWIHPRSLNSFRRKYYGSTKEE